jgi:3,4-dihydroxy 2-butanone 4-phosphate synthase/GTP cyclohydrolase II
MSRNAENSLLSSLEKALDELRSGRPVIVVDDENRENEGDLVLPAAYVTADWINFMATHARGLICVAMSGEALDRLGVPMMVPGAQNGSRFGSPFTVSVEAACGVTTGISAADRAETVRTLADPQSGSADIRSPGHIFPLRAHAEGLRARRGHTEASVALCAMIEVPPAAAICEIMNDDGTMARLPELLAFGTRHGLHVISIEQIVAAQKAHSGAAAEAGAPLLNGQASHPARSTPVRRSAEASLPTRFGNFLVTAYRDAEGLEHLLIHHGDLTDGAPLVRVHSECLTGDVLGSVRCDCGEQLHAALQQIGAEPAGALVYLRQEGRGIGLVNKIRAYALQDKGMDTVEANVCLGFRPDERSYAVAASILKDAGLSELRLLTNNPAKISGLAKNGVQVRERVPIVVAPRPENAHYLKTKRSRLSHLMDGLPVR